MADRRKDTIMGTFGDNFPSLKPEMRAKISEQINIIVRDYGLEKLSASEAHDALIGILDAVSTQKEPS